MLSPAPCRHWLTWALLLAAPMAAAQSPQCGLFKAEEGSGTLRVQSANRGEQAFFGSAPSPVVFQQIDGKLQLVNLEYGAVRELRIRDRGRTVEMSDTIFRLQVPAVCAAAAAPTEGSCLADAAACLDNRHEATPAALEAACREGVPGLCLELADRWHDDARAPAETRASEQKAVVDRALAGIELPAPCREDGFNNGTPACMAALEADKALQEKVIRAVMGAAMLETMSSLASTYAPVVVPSGRRMQLLQFCQQMPSDRFCKRVAELAWDSGDHLQAVRALALSCATGGEGGDCARLPGLQAVGPALRPQPATVLPCGSFHSDGSFMNTLTFGDAGLVGNGGNSQLRARIEDGDIRIRHDKGGDFVLRPLPGGKLLGLDNWTRYKVFTATDEGTSNCSAPKQYTVLPLPEDCPQAPADGGANACCAQGSLQGCHVLGNRLALSEQWPQAAAHFTTVCRAGVREGCENLVTAHGESPEVDARATLEQLCNADGSGHHVACDVLETGNWRALELGRALQKAMEDAAEGGIPPRNSNRKR
ncbi:MAG TPA: hypothetical protein DD677_11195 [Stenotrophomonas sp.]|nr:hypothetical protein [Stenotrophomonas sp.]